MRVLLELKGDYDKFGIINATIVKANHTGSIDEKYISKNKMKELKEYRFAYTNQPKERIV